MINKKIVELSNIEIYEHCILEISNGRKNLIKRKSYFLPLQDFILKMKKYFLHYTPLDIIRQNIQGLMCGRRTKT